MCIERRARELKKKKKEKRKKGGEDDDGESWNFASKNTVNHVREPTHAH